MEVIHVYRCAHCMKEVPPGAAFCPGCGQPPGTTAAQPGYCLRPFTILRGRYLVGRVLWQGNLGITYVGCDLHLGTRVAIKECFPIHCPGVHFSPARDSGVSNLVGIEAAPGDDRWMNCRDAFLRDARKLVKKEPVPEAAWVLDAFEENNTAYIVMEFVEGLTLREYVSMSGALPPERCVELFQPLIAALDRVHRQMILHRDIDLDSIMIEPSGRLRLVGLGAAREPGWEVEDHYRPLEKRPFRPLELYSKKGQIGPWTDVYAICAAIYYAITGRLVPSVLDRLEIDSSIEIPPGTLGRERQARLEAILQDGLALRTQERIQSMADLLARLDDMEPAPL